MKEIIGQLTSTTLTEGKAINLKLDVGQKQKLHVLVLRHQGQTYAWLNYCPHWGVQLGTRGDDYFTTDGQFLICQTHKALFRPDDGLCTFGPCIGQSLNALPLEEVDGVIKLFRKKNG